ncbi:uncharacterized protein [Primulina huaijiensis]|uniref:uncharacterized protein n=1 Tax=Primulina huaijiensis TaxID=1492673 RepID=UPI003CC753BC
MKLACWNIRGFHKPLKQRGVQTLVGTQHIDVIGILESKFDDKALQNLLRIRFPGMKATHNFDMSNKGRIFVLWNPTRVDLTTVCLTDQVLHARVKCLMTQKEFCISFIYGFNTIVQRRLLWNDLIRFGANCSSPWILLCDFNNVLTPDEKQGGLKVKNYETKDFVDCVAILDLLDLKFSGCFYTWMSPKVCSKLDRVLVNQAWLSSDLNGHTEFQAPGCLSDHTVSIVSLLEDQKQKPKAFKFFNMWTLSEKFLDLVLDRWKFEGYGTCQYRLKQLFKGLKKPLQTLNRQHFGNISSRAAAAKRRLEELQRNMLHTGTILDEYKQLKRKTEIVMEAERLFIAQKTKINYLK